jgi:hypothetical protein
MNSEEKMKINRIKIGLLAFLMLSIILFSGQAFAHPPQDMKIEYNVQTSTLDVTITHNSPGPTIHYVYRVEIEKNGELYLFEEYTSQPTTSTFTYSYIVEAEGGDEIRVEAICNIAGSIVRSTIVPNENSPLAPDISGKIEGKPNVEYDYSFVATDPNGDDVYYYIEWDDGTNSNWIGPYPSGQEITASHIWTKQGDYIISAKAKDGDENIGPTSTLQVSMPRGRFLLRHLFFDYIQILINRFSNLDIFI